VVSASEPSRNDGTAQRHEVQLVSLRFAHLMDASGGCHPKYKHHHRHNNTSSQA